MHEAVPSHCEETNVQVQRVVANFKALDLNRARSFYQDIFGLELCMDHGWIQTYGSRTKMTIQVSFAEEGGSGTPVPDLSIEVDDVESAYERVKASGFAIEYGPVDEPWGVRRFFVRDPFNKLINVLAHI
nr:VOC family protein [Burkholderia glumae]